MYIFLTIATLFPMIVALVLKSKYLKSTITLGIANLAIIAFYYYRLIRPNEKCVYAGNYDCENYFPMTLILLITIISIVIAIACMSFIKRESVTGVASKGTTRKVLGTVGIIIVLVAVLAIAGFIFALTQI